ncbi:hypothetical protein CFB74_gp5 [Culex mononega-like virus 2]|uniref:Uncharacterized protein n=1 Tax=Culex mononega-like virus 2 TaxID=2010272 RepID=A0A1Z2RT49_9MONO|nr:hypothetical protein CFB74_gp5 [Culex mononega-like virus 2]ASA47378.1 hypothetical protein [Culex mononega-like virus 2]
MWAKLFGLSKVNWCIVEATLDMHICMHMCMCLYEYTSIYIYIFLINLLIYLSIIFTIFQTAQEASAYVHLDTNYARKIAFFYCVLQ